VDGTGRRTSHLGKLNENVLRVGDARCIVCECAWVDALV